MHTLIVAIVPLLFAGELLAGDKSGEQVYQSVCVECHGKGLHGAPVFGSRKHWSKLVREGLDDLVPAALHGVRKMPAKGGKPELEDREVARAVIYMANAGGGKFVEPSVEDLARWRSTADRMKK